MRRRVAEGTRRVQGGAGGSTLTETAEVEITARSWSGEGLGQEGPWGLDWAEKEPGVATSARRGKVSKEVCGCDRCWEEGTRFLRPAQVWSERESELAAWLGSAGSARAPRGQQMAYPRERRCRANRQGAPPHSAPAEGRLAPPLSQVAPPVTSVSPASALWRLASYLRPRPPTIILAPPRAQAHARPAPQSRLRANTTPPHRAQVHPTLRYP